MCPTNCANYKTTKQIFQLGPSVSSVLYSYDSNSKENVVLLLNPDGRNTDWKTGKHEKEQENYTIMRSRLLIVSNPKWSKIVIVTFKLFQCNWSCGLQHERGYTNWKCGQNKRKMKSRWGSDRARAAAFCNPLSDFLSPGSHLESDHHFCLVFIWTDEVIGI